MLCWIKPLVKIGLCNYALAHNDLEFKIDYEVKCGIYDCL